MFDLFFTTDVYRKLGPDPAIEPVYHPRLIHITSLEQLRAAAQDWDSLWHRSDVSLPTFRAELVAQWIEQFTPQAELHVLAVEQHGRWVAALPLLRRRLAGLIEAAVMPGNEWTSCGELLLDRTVPTEAAMECFVAAMTELPCQLFWLDDVAMNSVRWTSLATAADRADLAMHYREHMKIGRIEIDHDWNGFCQSWSRKHRQQMTRNSRRLGQRGSVTLRLLSQLAPDEVERWLRRGFEIEDRSWKGAEGTSVLRTPGMFGYFVRQAKQAACWGQLELAFLESAGRPIAFAYGLNAKGVYHSIKVGYDPEFSRYSPGQLLRYHLYRQLFADPLRRAIDYMPPTEAHRKWRPTCQSLGRLVIASHRLFARATLSAYKHGWTPIRRLRAFTADR